MDTIEFLGVVDHAEVDAVDFIVAPNVGGESFDSCALIKNRDVRGEGELDRAAGMRGARESKDGEETDGFLWMVSLVGWVLE